MPMINAQKRFQLLEVVPIGKYPAVWGRSTRIYRLDVLDRAESRTIHFLLHSKNSISENIIQSN